MIFICVSLVLSRRARSSLYCSSSAVPSGKAYIPHFDGFLPPAASLTHSVSPTISAFSEAHHPCKRITLGVTP
ncbi:hypothetical protein DFP72DRAFT_923870 [Ephemerocybe angulata]|uniref:Secreted protein n=1 Tax=Ephemerocybe angulata TaxID=980116 RepID=A0A8H6HGZ6_9AGAR|nr:hypothetical protein DFP72DRAFT_923870 [Tulosesus angulatus]